MIREMEAEASSMKIKSYYSNSVEEAIQAARAELGAEAMLITSRRAPSESRHLGSYEVVFGTPAQPETQPGEPQPEELNAELAVLREQLEGIKRVLQPGGLRSQGYAQPEIEEVFQELLASGLDPRHARDLTDEACRAWHAGGSSFEQTMAGNLRQKLRFIPDYAADRESSRRMLVFCGPAGAGKTTSLAKIAIQEFLGRRMSVRVISVDPYRAGAHEKLRALTAIIGLGFTAANTIREFTEAVDEFQNKDVLLIDTPGYSVAECDAAREMASALGQIRSKETHLVLPASMQREELIRYAGYYQDFEANYLLFTKLDETEYRGSLISAALEANLPFSFFGTGQSIPEDIELSAAETLLASVFPKERAEAISAA
jgi:flagellar biosynthesis protein FlhF